MSEQVWRVFTAQRVKDGLYNIVSTRWTETGPQDGVIGRQFEGTEAEANAEAQAAQQRYDETRRNIVEAGA